MSNKDQGLYYARLLDQFLAQPAMQALAESESNLGIIPVLDEPQRNALPGALWPAGVANADSRALTVHRVDAVPGSQLETTRDGDPASTYTEPRPGFYPVGSAFVQTATASGSSAITIATGWSLNLARARRWGDFVELFFQTTRTGATIASSTTGDISNVTVGTVLSGWRPSPAAGMHSAGTGRIAAFGVASDGTISLSSLGGGADVPNGAVLTAHGTWMRA